MPSYFFHIALDLYQTSSTLDQLSKSFRIPFRPILIKNPVLQPAQDALSDQAPKKDKLCAVVEHPGDGKLLLAAHCSPKAVNAEATLFPAAHDWRYDRVLVQGIDMSRPAVVAKQQCNEDNTSTHLSNGLAIGPGGLATQGRYEPFEPEEEELGWGIIRLYRDAEATPGLYADTSTKASKGAKEKERLPFRDEDCTTLCILAVPSYLTPSDFLGFVGEKTREDVSHFRMIRTERSNRYMVLMKFRNGKKAREWRKEWNGKTFDGMEVGTESVEICYESYH